MARLPGGEAKFLAGLARLKVPVGQEALESFVLEAFFDRSETYPYAGDIRRQFEAATPVSRKMTGVGFYLDFYLPQDAPPVSTYPNGNGPTDLCQVRFANDEIGLFTLWFEEGRIASLEGVAIDNWPDDVSKFQVIES